MLNETHDPALTSWVSGANQDSCDFPIQNLPFGVMVPAAGATPRGSVAIGDQVLDLQALHASGVLSGAAQEAARLAAAVTLNDFMAAGAEAWSSLRLALSRLLRVGASASNQSAVAACLLPMQLVTMVMPAHVGDYTDFYTSIHHATAVGKLFRPDQPLLPNYRWVPIGYHGRASSIEVSPQSFKRPVGQRPTSGGGTPVVGPSARLDIELELGAFVGPGNTLGTPIPMSQAESHLFGLCLLNDWSARDLQAWEYQPLGPFLAKNFATTISPWIVTLEALAPFRTGWARDPADVQPLPYLSHPDLARTGAVDVQLEIVLQTAAMRSRAQAGQRIAATSYRHAYWTLAQLVAHHTVNGCNLRAGDLLGTGTLSGPQPEQAGSLLELSGGGKVPLVLADGEQRVFLEDGDRVTLRGWCEASGARRIGFGEATGTVLPAMPV